MFALFYLMFISIAAKRSERSGTEWIPEVRYPIELESDSTQKGCSLSMLYDSLPMQCLPRYLKYQVILIPLFFVLLSFGPSAFDV